MIQNHRYLPSNHTICEVSEKESELDEKSRLARRYDLKSTLNTCQSSLIINPQKSIHSNPHSSLSKHQIESLISS